MMIGPALAGFLVGTAGPRRAVEFAALGFVATVVTGLAIRTRRGRVTDPKAASAEIVETSGWALRRDPLLWTSVWGLTAVMTAIAAVNVVLVFFIIRTLGSSEQMFGLVDSMWTVGLLPGAWLFSRWTRPGTEDATIARRLFLALGAISIALVLAASASAAWWIVPCYLIGGANNAGLNVLGATLLGRRVPAAARGRANAALAMRAQAGALVGFLAGGLLLAVADPRWILLGCGVLGLVTVLAVRPLVTRAAGPLPQPAVGMA